MRRYYFHTDAGPDAEGILLASLEAAKCEAIKFAGCLVCEESNRPWNETTWRISVTDEAGLVLFHLQIVGTEAPGQDADTPSSKPEA